LGAEEAGGLGGHLLGGVVKRALGQVGAQGVQQRVETLARDRRNGGQAVRRSGGLRDQVRLRVHREHGRARRVGQTRHGGGGRRRILRERVQVGDDLRVGDGT